MGIGFRELLVILAIALLVFGAGKLKNIGSDLGAAVRGSETSCYQKRHGNLQLLDLLRAVRIQKRLPVTLQLLDLCLLKFFQYQFFCH